MVLDVIEMAPLLDDEDVREWLKARNPTAVDGSTRLTVKLQANRESLRKEMGPPFPEADVSALRALIAPERDFREVLRRWIDDTLRASPRGAVPRA
jgi:hypothetical protein